MFQYAVTVALNHEEIQKDPQRILKIKPFINKYNWEGINFSSKKDERKKLEKNNVLHAKYLYAKKINVLYAKKKSKFCFCFII